MRVLVVGGGIAGLATAWFLTRTAPPDLGLEVRLLEPDDPTGGKARSTAAAGFVFERGPHAILDHTEEVRVLIREVGLEGRLLRARPAARRRQVLHGGRLRTLPSSPIGLLRSDLMPLRGRLRALREPWIAPLPSERPDESVAEFFRRRVGPHCIAPLVEPFVTGVYAGDVERLSLRSAFPALHQLEREHRSLVRGALALARSRRRAGQPAPSTCSFPGGVGELARAVEAALPSGSRIRGEATRLHRDGSGFAVDVRGEGPSTLLADALVLAVPADAARRLTDPLDSDLASNIGLIPHAGVTVVCLAYDWQQVGAGLESFGFLCARAEGRRILGCVFASSAFEGHAPPGKVSLRVLMGGVHRPDLVALPEEAAAELAHDEVRGILDIRGAPELVQVFRWPQAIPQYNLGHQSRLEAIDGRMRYFPRLYLTGATYRGVSVSDCVRNGAKTARNLVRHLLTESGRSGI